MKKVSIGLKSNHKPIITFNNSENNLINNCINGMIKNKKMEWSFSALEKNYKVLFSNTDLIFTKLAIENNDTWEKLEKAALEINRNLLNYLATQNTFLDHSRHFLSQTFGKNSPEFKNFEILTTKLFDENFAYRFLYKIRNYTVHCGFALSAISISKNKSEIIYTPKFMINELLLSKDWGPVKSDLLKIKDDFSAFDIVKDCFICFKILQEYLINFLSKSNLSHQNNILELLKIEKNSLKDYCFLIENGIDINVAEIPIHYFK